MTTGGPGEAAQDADGDGDGDGRLSAPSALRNRDAIAAALADIAPMRGRALEIASGTGEHVIRFAAVLPGLHWQPTDPDPARRASIAAWSAIGAYPNIAAPIALDACTPGWAAQMPPQDLVFVANLLHLVTDDQARACLDGMAQALAPGGVAVVYGPFLRDGKTTSDGDAAFHARIRAETPGAGYKDLRFVEAAWAEAGLDRDAPCPMPANNLLLVARKSATPVVT